MKRLVFDFETRSECDLQKCGAYVYASHPSTEVLCCGYSYLGETYLVEYGGDYAHFFECVANAEVVVAHNYLFEKNILEKNKKFLGRQCFGLNWSCTSARALAYALPRGLEALAFALDIPIQKDMTGHRVMLKMCKPRRESKHDKRKYFDSDADFEILYSYCLRDVEVQTKIDQTLYELSKNEQRVWQLDSHINNRGIPIDTKLVEKAKAFAETFTSGQNMLMYRRTDGEISSAGQVAKLKSYFARYDVDIPNFTAATVNEYLEKDIHDFLKELLEIRKNVSKSSVKKLKAMIDRTGTDNRARGGMVYHTATTGRWGGSGIQIQNLPRPITDEDETINDLINLNYMSFNSKYPRTTEALSSCLRGMIAAPEGKKFIVADFAAIEARMIMWLSKCSLGVAQFVQNKPIYEEMGARILSKPVSDIVKNERQLGKQAILGCGYGMGAAKFQITCEGYGMDVDLALATSAVKTYRETYKEIPQFWYGLENAAISAVRARQLSSYNDIKFKVIGKYLFCQLPSGRKLSYYDPKLEKTSTPWGAEKEQLTFMGVDSLTKKWVRQKTYGGKLAENITQAAARDCMVNSMFAVEAAGYTIIFTVHDEIVCEVDQGFGQLSEFERLMEIPPSWGLDIPIKVEGYVAKRFRK